MIRLLIHVEGPTEETFVNQVLAPYLYRVGIFVSALIMGPAQSRSNRGGVVAWSIARKGILDNLKEDREIIVSTMVDYYGMPTGSNRAWPGRLQANSAPFNEKADTIHDAMLEDVRNHMGDSFNPARFVPYVMMHEFEAMLFSHCARFANAIESPHIAAGLQAIRDQFSAPEEIDDSPETAPSKRITELMPEYRKPRMGTQGAQAIGIDTIRNECPNFDNWLSRLVQSTGNG